MREFTRVLNPSRGSILRCRPESQPRHWTSTARIAPVSRYSQMHHQFGPLSRGADVQDGRRKKLRGVVFDMDGTLCTQNPSPLPQAKPLIHDFLLSRALCVSCS